MSKHTPGPWTFREHSLTDEMLEEARSVGITPIRFINNDGSVPVTAGDKRICTADCQSAFKRGTGHRAECEERDANARLIAAAPDLLALAYQFEKVALYQIKLSVKSGDTEGARMQTVTLNLIREAIAKAEGR